MVSFMHFELFSVALKYQGRSSGHRKPSNIDIPERHWYLPSAAEASLSAEAAQQSVTRKTDVVHNNNLLGFMSATESIGIGIDMQLTCY